MLFLMAKLVYILAGEYLNEMFILKQTVNTVIISAYFSSATHVVLLSLQQYIFLAYPLKSNVWFRNIKVIMVSALTWTICISLGVVYVYVVVVNQDTNKSLASIFNIVMTFLITLIPVGFLTMLHFLKRNVLTNALVHRPNKTVRKMARVVRLVIAGYLLTTTPVNIKDIIEVSVGFLNETWFVLLYQISTVLLYLNYTVNPFIYFFSTPQFRRTIVATFCKKPTVRSGSYNTSGVITNTSFVSKWSTLVWSIFHFLMKITYWRLDRIQNCKGF